jgi:hypothetical protein
MALQVSVSASLSDSMKIMTQTAYPVANQRSKLWITELRMKSVFWTYYRRYGNNRRW